MSTQSHSAWSASGKRFSVVVGLDFTDADGPAFDQAARLAVRVPDSELHLVHVFGTEPSAESSRELIENLRHYVNEKAATTSGLPGLRVGIHLRWGRAVRKLIQFAMDVRADLIVIGSHKGPRINDWMSGSTVERLVSAASFQVLVASPRPRVPDERDKGIEPPCSACTRARSGSGGQSWWCDRHIHAAQRAHAFSYQRELPLTPYDSEIIPTGISV
jgi:nucleotide-binding universal stress UspA family protein